ncbi:MULTISPECIES: ABC transporter permease subunit [unclassified Sporolactobacillus]|uniref:ABC transporter permease subunit n=1 Tax=unclassified Sporolactobacillus TaxID=2628533 RepID=UPI00236796A3|nr:ABC transporter permease subunit [Sporolactobacillus sp. CQH2019]MDD9149705.1 ABC transporter permease subunit [Sporolactobacillus sp. CQH2019]
MTLFRLECKTHVKTLLIWIIVVGLLTLGLVSLFPSMKDMGLQQIDLKSMPKEMLKAFNISDMSALASIEGYFGYEFQYVMIATGIFAATLGLNALAREESEGTISYLYAQPISRVSIVSLKMLANALFYTLYWLVTMIIAFLVCLIFKESTASVSNLFKDFSLLTFAGWVMGLTFFSVGFFLSSLLSSNKSATSLSLALVFLTFILGVVGKLQDKFQALVYFSPVDTALPSSVFKNGLQWKYIVTDLIVLVVSLLLAFWIYRRKDLKA